MRSSKNFSKYDFLKESILSHRTGQFIYFLNSYDKISEKVKIICPSHGVFYQKASRHISGSGCKKCENKNKARLLRTSPENFFEKVRSIHKNKYDYSNSIYETVSSILKIGCPIHGEFYQKASEHLSGHGCQKCGREKTVNSSTYTLQEILEKFKTIHGNKYDYSKFLYSGFLNPSLITCKIHGDFLQKPREHLDGCGCQKCNSGFSVSSQELNILDFIKKFIEDDKIIGSAKPDFLNGKELDIYLPEHKIAIEFNGIRWHSERIKDKWYHFDKTKSCRENGITLLHIWEHYWNIPEKRKIYFSKILHLLGLDEKVYARKCNVLEIDFSTYSNFIKVNHIEGTAIPYKDMSFLGLYFDSKLVMVIGYGYHWNQSKKATELKIQRICTTQGITVIGGVSKLLKEVSRRTNNEKIVFQITLDTGGRLSFNKPILRKDVSLRYWWVKSNSYKTRNQCQVINLKNTSSWIDSDTENSYMTRLGWNRLWDSGIYTIDNLLGEIE